MIPRHLIRRGLTVSAWGFRGADATFQSRQADSRIMLTKPRDHVTAPAHGRGAIHHGHVGIPHDCGEIYHEQVGIPHDSGEIHHKHVAIHHGRVAIHHGHVAIHRKHVAIHHGHVEIHHGRGEGHSGAVLIRACNA